MARCQAPAKSTTRHGLHFWLVELQSYRKNLLARFTRITYSGYRCGKVSGWYLSEVTKYGYTPALAEKTL